LGNLIEVSVQSILLPKYSFHMPTSLQ